MDLPPQHIIKRQTIELHGLPEAEVRTVQENVRTLFYQKIVPMLDRYCSKLSSSEKVYRIDAIELDLGRLDGMNLEASLLKEMDRQLAEYFEPLLLATEQDKNEPDPGVGPVEEIKHHYLSRLQLLRYFVKTGNLPWWENRTGHNPISESLSYLIEHQSTVLRKLMHEWAGHPLALKRILRHSDSSLWAELAIIQMETDRQVLVPMFTQLLFLLRELSSRHQYAEPNLEQMLWLGFLSTVYTSPEKVKDTSGFWQIFFRQFAKNYQIPYKQLIADLWQRLEQNEPAHKGSDNYLRHHLYILAKEVENRSNEQIPSTTDRQVYLIRRISQILKAKNIPPETKKEWEEVLHRLKDRDLSDKDWEPILQLLRQTEEQAQTGSQPSPEERKSKEREAHDEGLQTELIKRIRQLLTDRSVPPATKEYWKEVLQKLSAHDMPAAELADLFNQLRQSETSDPGKPEPDRFSEAEELFIDNAGLVILSPYFPRFFHHLGLIKDRHFLHEAAAHRAVGLLQYLADGQPLPAEYHCGLNKILCGLDWNAVLDFGEPVTPKEDEICESLLQSAIANAPILGDMSIQGFRGSFLLRKGVLKAGTGIWQLHVERETYDIVLERFPWSWKMVKLPWMEWGIGVEWVM